MEVRKLQAQDKIRHEVRLIHEAYQFLAKKYKHDKQRLKEKLEYSDELIKIADDNEEENDEVFGMDKALAAKAALKTWKTAKPEDKADTAGVEGDAADISSS